MVGRLCARLRHATSGRRFRPSLVGGVVALAVAGGCIALGNWQYAKFERKEAAQAQLDRRAADAPITLGGVLVEPEALRARPVVVRGRFEGGRQFLVDNRIHREQAGYHVITPLRIDGSENPDIPPFGGQIDYLTYAGIYREVWLKVCEAISIERIKIETGDELTDAKSVSVRCTLLPELSARWSNSAQFARDRWTATSGASRAASTRAWPESSWATPTVAARSPATQAIRCPAPGISAVPNSSALPSAGRSCAMSSTAPRRAA